MTPNNKKKALKVTEDMQTEGCTNLWDGILKGLTLANSTGITNTFVVVLSDGEPNEHPPGGELAALDRYLMNNPLKCSMSMFGYGYSLNT